MEKLSRIKKYEELRKFIETDNPVDTKEEAVAPSEHTLRQFDSSVLKKVDIKEESYQPEREKQFEENEPVKHADNDSASFTNEYLDDFIQEVREYNIRKGTREYEDTQVDILSQLNAVNRAKRSQYVEPIPSEEKLLKDAMSNLTKEDIALEVANLLKDDDVEQVSEDVESPLIQEFEEVKQNNKQRILPIVEEPEELEDEEEEEPVKKRGFFKRKEALEEEDEIEREPNKKEAIDPVAHKKLLEETQQLRVQMDEYEDELTDLSNGVEKTNKLLNFVLCFLILVLLVIIGFIVYSLLKAGGKI